MYAKKASIMFTTWEKIRNEVGNVNTELTNIIDNISPDKNYPLIKVKFPFGSKLIEKGKLQLPNKDGRLVPLSDPSIEKHLHEMLSYNAETNPVSIILKNSAEIFLPINNHTCPLYGVIRPGSVLSTSKILGDSLSHSPAFLWEMTAGARSLFLLPKIAENSGYKRLEKYFNSQFEKPKHLDEQWNLFRKLIELSENDWYTEMLYFPKVWIKKIKDRAWKALYLYLIQKAWNKSEFWRNQFVWDMAFSVIRSKKCLKINPYVADTVKHLLFMATGAIPEFSPAVDNQIAPINVLQKIFTEIYELDYYPTIMHPYQFSQQENLRPVYYSLEYPSLQEFPSKNRVITSKISDLYEIKLLLEKYITEIKNDTLNIGETLISNAMTTTKFKFFHSEPNEYQGILKNSGELFNDQNLSKNIFCPLYMLEILKIKKWKL